MNKKMINKNVSRDIFLNIQSFFNSSFYDDQILEKILYDIIIPLTNKNFITTKKLSQPKGVVFYGPDGVGKMNLATIITEIMQCPKVILSPTEVINQLKVGKGEILISNTFFKASQLACKNRSAGEKDNPFNVCCLIIPNLDYIAQKRTSISGYMTSSVVTALLSEIDNINSGSNNGTVFVIATTTDVSVIDVDLRSTTRLGLEIFLPPPNLETRKNILNELFSTFEKNDELVNLIAQETPGFSHADLRELISLMTKSAIKKKYHSLDQILKGSLEDLNIDDNLIIDKTDYLSAKKFIHPSGLRDKTFFIPDVKISDVYGLSSQKSIINDNIVQYIKNKSTFTELGLKSIKGIILHGPPGNGKTLLAKAVANEVDWNFILVSGPELLSKYVGESEEQVREVFERARLYSPCIIFFDEIDSIAPRRDKSQDTHVYASTVGQLLAEIDGIRPLDDVIIMGATNRLELVDPALLREGRIDFKLFVPLPDESARKEFFKNEIQKLQSRNRLGEINEDSLCIKFCQQTEGLSGSALQFILSQTSRIALKKSNYSINTVVTENDFEESLKNYKK